jgi:hypothetical protein
VGSPSTTIPINSAAPTIQPRPPYHGRLAREVAYPRHRTLPRSNQQERQQLRGVIERDEAAIGVFITLEPPTAPMRKEAADAGFFHSALLTKTKHPRLQILTIEELLAGKKIDMPAAQDIRSFKQLPF